jgi:hypothetical protein
MCLFAKFDFTSLRCYLTVEMAPSKFTSLGYWDPPIPRTMRFSSGYWPDSGDWHLMKDDGVKQRSPVYFKEGKSDKHFQLVDGEGRLACVEGDWVRFFVCFLPPCPIPYASLINHYSVGTRQDRFERYPILDYRRMWRRILLPAVGRQVAVCRKDWSRYGQYEKRRVVVAIVGEFQRRQLYQLPMIWRWSEAELAWSRKVARVIFDAICIVAVKSCVLCCLTKEAKPNGRQPGL